MKLDVGQRRGLVGIPEGAGLEEARGRRPALEHDVLQTGPQGEMRLGVGIIAVGPGTFRDGEEIEMVVQVPADARQIVQRCHAHGLQLIRGSDARLQQELRRADGARGDDDLALGPQRSRGRRRS